jgi:hypothetical protein
MVWKQLTMEPEVAALADFAILLLGMVVSRAGNERTFSRPEDHKNPNPQLFRNPKA